MLEIQVELDHRCSAGLMERVNFMVGRMQMLLPCMLSLEIQVVMHMISMETFIVLHQEQIQRI